jgi:Domain of unknown function (DUF4168)
MNVTACRFWRLSGLRILAAAALGAASVIMLPLPNSQAQTLDQPRGQSAAPPISDQKINAAADAMVQVASLRQSYQQKIAAAPASEKPRITGEAQSAMEKAVTDRGLSVAEYNTIVEAARSDPNIRQKLVQHLPAAGGQAAPPAESR